VLLLFAPAIMISTGCQPLSPFSKSVSETNFKQNAASQVTFNDVLQHTNGNPLPGKVVAEMDGNFNPDLQRFALTTQTDKAIFVIEESMGGTKLVIVNPDGTVKQETFPGYKLKRVLLNNKILYVGFKGKSAIKFNTDSYDYSEVDESELEHSRAALDEFVLPGKEKPVYTAEGYVYTEDGFIFDIKNHEYLNDDNKKQFYDFADFGYNSYLFRIEPRLDQAINLKVIKAKGDKTAKGGSYPIHLDLPIGYDVHQITHAIGKNGTLYLFASGVKEDGKQVAKMFEIPLRSFSDPE
jgi:hypothetical protein